ncbi:MAG: PBP1A family penicillin-binding protein [Holophaga sp.]|nr:PBP1A family penicillin-binding protein [Holophaga sp.]
MIRWNPGTSCHPALLGAVLVLGLAVPASAQENIASYPTQPPGVTSITVLDHQGRFVGRIMPQRRYWVSIDRIPAFLQQALLAVEDTRFYEHGGIDLRGIARAALKDAVHGKMVEGGSTITQQLIKNKFLSSEVSIDRKVKEARMAIEFEKKYSKRQILEMYFNEIYYGNGAMGISQAARIYFNKSAEELNPAECVMLAGVPKNPGRYNPLGKPADVAARRDVVLKRLTDLNILSAKQAQAMRAHPAPVAGPGQAPYYLAQIRAKLIEHYGAEVVEQGGLEVVAALDLNLQKQAEQALRDGVRRIAPDLQGAMICMDPFTGDVLAAVGGVDGGQNSLNRAFASKRQPGSSIKPLIYAAALEKGITASSMWNDTPVAYHWGNGQVWKPHNYGNERFGDMSMRQALAHSDNVVTVKLLDTIGVPYFVDFAGKLGLPLRTQSGLSLALGTEEVTLNDLVQAYTPLATGGGRAQTRTILKVWDNRSRSWLENPPVVTPGFSPAAAFVTTQMMKDVLTYGTAKGLKKFSQSRPAAGKTGTTDNFRDAWFIGFTPQLLTGVWVGYDRPRPGGRSFTGGVVAAPIWERFMSRALSGRPPVDFPKPDTVVSVAINPTTGKLAAEDDPIKRQEFYISGTEPKADGASPVPEPAALDQVQPPASDSEETPAH